MNKKIVAFLLIVIVLGTSIVLLYPGVSIASSIDTSDWLQEDMLFEWEQPLPYAHGESWLVKDLPSGWGEASYEDIPDQYTTYGPEYSDAGELMPLSIGETRYIPEMKRSNAKINTMNYLGFKAYPDLKIDRTELNNREQIRCGPQSINLPYPLNTMLYDWCKVEWWNNYLDRTEGTLQEYDIPIQFSFEETLTNGPSCERKGVTERQHRLSWYWIAIIVYSSSSSDQPYWCRWFPNRFGCGPKVYARAVIPYSSVKHEWCLAKTGWNPNTNQRFYQVWITKRWMEGSGILHFTEPYSGELKGKMMLALNQYHIVDKPPLMSWTSKVNVIRTNIPKMRGVCEGYPGYPREYKCYPT